MNSGRWMATGLVAGAAFAAGCAAGLQGGALSPPAAADPAPAAPVYMVVLGDVLDREAFMQGYAAHMPALYAEHGGRYLAVGRGVEFLEGEGDFESYVIAEWPSREAAHAFWNSERYDELRRARIDGEWGRFDVFLVDGLPAPSPASAPDPSEP